MPHSIFGFPRLGRFPHRVQTMNAQPANLKTAAPLATASERLVDQLADKIGGLGVELADIAGVENMLRPLQGFQRFRTQQTVRVGNDADAHGLEPDHHTRAWIEIVTQCIADEVEGEHAAHHG